MSGLALFSVVVCVLAVASTLQTICGFGFSIVAAPALLIILPLAETISIVAASGLVTNVLILVLRRTVIVLDRRSLTITVGSVPGLVSGGLAIAVLPSLILQVFLLLSVVVTAVFYVATAGQRVPLRRLELGAGDIRVSTVVTELFTGLGSGFLATTTSVSGPPLLAFTRRFGLDPVHSRDLLVRVSLLQGPIAIGSLLFAGAMRFNWLLVACLPVGILGDLIGNYLLNHGAKKFYSRIAMAVLVLAVCLSIVMLIVDGS